MKNWRKGTGVVTLAAALWLAPAAGAATSASATLTRDGADASGATLFLTVTNTGDTDISELIFTLNDTALGNSDSYQISGVTPASRCGPQNPSGAPHGLACTWNLGEFPAGATMKIAFVTNPRYPNRGTQAPNGGGMLSINGGTAAYVPGPPDTPPVAAFVFRSTGPSGVALDGTSSHDPDGTVDVYSWDFGDGTTARGPLVTHQYASPGMYTITLVVADNDGVSSTAVTKTFTAMAPPPVTSETPAAPTSSDKAFFADATMVTAHLAITCFSIAGVTSVTGVGEPVALLATGAGLAALVWNNVFDALAKDPPDPSFHVVVKPKPPKAPNLRSGHGLSRAVAAAANRMFGNASTAAGLLQAMVTSINRASGAAQAGDASAESQQVLAAARYARSAAGRLRTDINLRARLVKVLRGEHLNARISAKSLAAFRRRVEKHGLPAAVVVLLRRAGVTNAQRQMLIHELTTAHKLSAGNLLAALGSAKLTRAERAAATALSGYASARGA